jgi:hypothetical protein
MTIVIQLQERWIAEPGRAATGSLRPTDYSTEPGCGVDLAAWIRRPEYEDAGDLFS